VAGAAPEGGGGEAGRCLGVERSSCRLRLWSAATRRAASSIAVTRPAFCTKSGRGRGERSVSRGYGEVPGRRDRGPKMTCWSFPLRGTDLGYEGRILSSGKRNVLRALARRARRRSRAVSARAHREGFALVRRNPAGPRPALWLVPRPRSGTFLRRSSRPHRSSQIRVECGGMTPLSTAGHDPPPSEGRAVEPARRKRRRVAALHMECTPYGEWGCGDWLGAWAVGGLDGECCVSFGSRPA
jgi:hypothetical protein